MSLYEELRKYFRVDKKKPVWAATVDRTSPGRKESKMYAYLQVVSSVDKKSVVLPLLPKHKSTENPIPPTKGSLVLANGWLYRVLDVMFNYDQQEITVFAVKISENNVSLLNNYGDTVINE